jgi:hypothetical protein
MKNEFVNFGLQYGLFIGRTTDDSRVRTLLNLLRPMRTNLPLVRLGAPGDGGYLVPDDFEGIEACFSPGVDVKASFESMLVDRGIPCFLADASVERAPISHPLVDFERRFLGVTDVHPLITMDTWVSQKRPAHGNAMILQMDIEGAEWPVLLNMSDKVLLSFRIIVLELHMMNRIFDEFGLTIIEAVLNRLLRDFVVVHLHPNNFKPAVRRGDICVTPFLEMTLIRKDRVRILGRATQFPHPLDVDCVPRNRSEVLSPIFTK